MLFLPVSVPVDFVPAHSVKPSFGYFLVGLILELVLPAENATPEGGVGVEGEVVVSETGDQLLLHLPGKNKYKSCQLSI